MRNEEAILEDCLTRLAFADELVVVLDRCTDGSRVIAARYADTLIEGAWEIEGDRRNLGIRACSGEWVLEIDADEWVAEDMGREVRSVIATDAYDAFDYPVLNHVGGRLLRYGWGGLFGATAFPGLFRSGYKRWGHARVHPHVEVGGRRGPMLANGVLHHVDRSISDMLRRLDRCTDLRALDLIELGEANVGLTELMRRTISRFWKIFVVRKGYKEKEIGFMIALCGAIYPLIAHIKAQEQLQQRGRQA